jgi:hypothetical protein
MAELVCIWDSDIGGFIGKDVGTTHLANQAVTSAKVAAGAIGTPHLANEAVMSAKIGAQAVGGAHLNPNDVWPGRTFSGIVRLRRPDHQDVIKVTALPSGQPATLLVDSGLLGWRFWHAQAGNLGYFQSGAVSVPGRVDNVDISAHTHGAGAGDAPNILSASIAALAVGTPHIANQAILSAKIGAGAIGTPHLANAAVVSASIGSEAIGNPHIRSGVVDAAKLTGTLQDARLPTTQTGKAFSGNINIRGARLIISGQGNQDAIVLANPNPRDIEIIRSGYPSMLWRYMPDDTDVMNIFDLTNNAHQIRFKSGGGIVLGGNVDSVDISAHTHTGGTGDAGQVLSAGIGSEAIGNPHIRSGVVDAAKLTGTLQDARLPTTQKGKVFSSEIQFRLISGRANVYKVSRPDHLGPSSSQPDMFLMADPQQLFWTFWNGDSWREFIRMRRTATATDIVFTGLPLNSVGNVDSVDISAHTHGGGAGDAPNILSASIAAEAIGNPHIRSGVVDAAKLTGTLQDARIPTTLSGRTFRGKVTVEHPTTTADSFLIVAKAHSGWPWIRLEGGKAGTYGGSLAWCMGTSSQIRWLPHYSPFRLLLYSDVAGGEWLSFRSGGHMVLLGQVDSVDVSAHTHTGGAGDAGQVLSAGIGAGAVGYPHLAVNSVTSSKIGAGEVGTAHLANGTVVSSKIASGQVGKNHLSFPAAQLATDFYTGDGTSGRQITIGFAPKLVKIVGLTVATYLEWTVMTSAISEAILHHAATGAHWRGNTVLPRLDHSDGFHVGDLSLPERAANYSGASYVYTAFG